MRKTDSLFVYLGILFVNLFIIALVWAIKVGIIAAIVYGVWYFLIKGK